MDTIKHKKLVWLDIQNPSPADIAHLQKNFKLHPVVLKELQQETLRPHVDNYNSYLYLVLHFPLFNEKDRRTYAKELDFILTKNTLVTAHFNSFELLDELFKKAKTDTVMREKYLAKGPAYLLYQIITLLFDFSLRELDHIKINIDKVQDQMFRGREKDMVQEISYIRHDILNFRRTILPQRPVLESLVREGTQFFGAGFRYYFEELVGKFILIWNHLENQKEAVEALQQTNESLLSTKTNEVIRTLTVITSIIFTLSLIADVYLMRGAAGLNPSLGLSNALMIIVALIMLALFKKKKWY